MPLKRGRHLQEEQLEAYTMGTIPADEAAELEEHLLTCQACRDHLRETDEYVQAMQRAAGRLRGENL